jgi:DNA-directed RNA polymerase specialized sigma24 family protein
LDGTASFKGQTDIGSRYACALAEVRRNDFSHLRSYAGQAGFTTWLVVLGRRLAAVHENGQCQCGPDVAGRSAETEERAHDRSLIDAVAERLDLRHIADPTGTNPERELRSVQLRHKLAEVLGELSNHDRLMLTLRLQDGLPNRDVSRVMGLSTAYHAGRSITNVLHSVRRRLG